MGTLHSDYHMPAGNYLYQSNVSVKDSAFSTDRIDQELVASKGLDKEHILATNIEEIVTFDPNTFPHYATEYKLKTIIEVSEPVGRDRYMEPCQYILTVFGPSRYDPAQIERTKQKVNVSVLCHQKNCPPPNIEKMLVQVLDQDIVVQRVLIRVNPFGLASYQLSQYKR